MTAPELLTAEDLYDLPDGYRYNLIRGELIRSPYMVWGQGRAASNLAWRVGTYIEEHQLGDAFATGTGFILARDPDTVLAPEFAVVRSERLLSDLPGDEFLPFAPDLAVQVVSPSDTLTEINDKVINYINAGAGLIWVVDPWLRVITVYRPDGSALIVREDGVIDGEAVLPGFSLLVREIFE
jgi:Uma2 family endonuclease